MKLRDRKGLNLPRYLHPRPSSMRKKVGRPPSNPATKKSEELKKWATQRLKKKTDSEKKAFEMKIQRQKLEILEKLETKSGKLEEPATKLKTFDEKAELRAPTMERRIDPEKREKREQPISRENIGASFADQKKSIPLRLPTSSYVNFLMRNRGFVSGQFRPIKFPVKNEEIEIEIPKNPVQPLPLAILVLAEQKQKANETTMVAGSSVDRSVRDFPNGDRGNLMNVIDYKPVLWREDGQKIHESMGKCGTRKRESDDDYVPNCDLGPCQTCASRGIRCGCSRGSKK